MCDLIIAHKKETIGKTVISIIPTPIEESLQEERQRRGNPAVIETLTREVITRKEELCRALRTAKSVESPQDPMGMIRCAIIPQSFDFTPNPLFSESINNKLKVSHASGSVDVSRLPDSTEITLYFSGGTRLNLEVVATRTEEGILLQTTEEIHSQKGFFLSGSTFGGSMIKTKHLGPNTFPEIRTIDGYGYLPMVRMIEISYAGKPVATLGMETIN